MYFIDQLQTNKEFALKLGKNIFDNRLVISEQKMKGVHDAQFVIVADRAYAVYEANDVMPGESHEWDFVYAAMTVVDIIKNSVIKTVKFAYGERQFKNLKLPHGCAFVPRIIKKDEKTLRVFFASIDEGVRPQLTYYMDYDLEREEFTDEIYVLDILTDRGRMAFTPEIFREVALRAGHACFERSIGAYLFDIEDYGDVKYICLNNFATGQNALAKFNDGYDCIEILGHIGEGMDGFKTTESGIAKLNDGTFMAVLREEYSKQYYFSYSLDGREWTYPIKKAFAADGCNTKPTLNNFDGTLFMSVAVNDRSCMRLSFGYDGEHWKELLEVQSPTTFQYPSFVYYENEIYYTATTGNKEQIVFGKLPLICVDGKFCLKT